MTGWQTLAELACGCELMRNGPSFSRYEPEWALQFGCTQHRALVSKDERDRVQMLARIQMQQLRDGYISVEQAITGRFIPRMLVRSWQKLLTAQEQAALNPTRGTRSWLTKARKAYAATMEKLDSAERAFNAVMDGQQWGELHPEAVHDYRNQTGFYPSERERVIFPVLSVDQMRHTNERGS